MMNLFPFSLPKRRSIAVFGKKNLSLVDNLYLLRSSKITNWDLCSSLSSLELCVHRDLTTADEESRNRLM